MEAFRRFWGLQITKLAIFGVYKWAPGQILAMNGPGAHL